MDLSVGVLYDCQKFISLCEDQAFLIEDVKSSYRARYEVASIDAVLDLLRQAHWMSFDDDGHLRLTARGRDIHACQSEREALRLQIMDYVVHLKPAWSGLIPKGRLETLPFLSANARQCFREADLVDGYSDDVIAFWDQAANVSRGRNDDVLLEIGREGERLSIRHEIERTGREPDYKAIDSNLAGYDLISVVSREDATPLKIEVKATRRLEAQAYYLSRGEWETASGAGQWILHMWLLGNPPVLIKKQRDVVAFNVPVDNGLGSWQSVKIAIDGGTSEQ